MKFENHFRFKNPFNKCREEIAVALNEFVSDGAEENMLNVML